MNKEIIQYIGVNELEAQEQDVVNRLSAQYYEKIKGMLNNFTSLKVHVKTHNTEGARKRYTLNLQVIAPTQAFDSNKAEDWDLPRTLHKGFEDLMANIRHALHVDDQKPRG